MEEYIVKVNKRPSHIPIKMPKIKGSVKGKVKRETLFVVFVHLLFYYLFVSKRAAMDAIPICHEHNSVGQQQNHNNHVFQFKSRYSECNLDPMVER